MGQRYQRSNQHKTITLRIGMKRGTEQRTVRSFCRRLKKINLQPDYQRGAVWGVSQKQLLIDSILRDLDIPKIYLREVQHDEFPEEAIDGQQRLTAISQFYADEFSLAKDADPVQGFEIKGKTFSQLHEDIKDVFEAYELSVVILRDASNEDVEEMFLRLQNGTTLNAAEKRNAMPGNIKTFVRELGLHGFFPNCNFKNQRFAYDLVAAQMLRTAIAGEPCAVKDRDLVKMYEGNVEFDIGGRVAKEMKRTLDALRISFPDKTPELSKLNALSLFILFRYLRENFDVKSRLVEIGNWFIQFETWRRADQKRPSDEREPEMVAYQEKTTSTTDSQDSIQYRHQVLLTRLLRALPDLAPLDSQRNFTYEQRLAIYRRDEGICQLGLTCEHMKCGWDHWHSDHKVAWSNGGPTTVENGQVACQACNLVKSAN